MSSLNRTWSLACALVALTMAAPSVQAQDFHDGHDGHDAWRVNDAAQAVNNSAQALYQQFVQFQNNQDHTLLNRPEHLTRYLTILELASVATEVSQLASKLIDGQNNPWGHDARPDFAAAAQVLNGRFAELNVAWQGPFQSDLTQLGQNLSYFTQAAGEYHDYHPHEQSQIRFVGLAVDGCLDLVVYGNHARLATGADLNDGGCRSTPQDGNLAHSQNLNFHLEGNRPFNPDYPTTVVSEPYQGGNGGSGSVTKLGVFTYGSERAVVIRIQDSSAGSHYYTVAVQF